MFSININFKLSPIRHYNSQEIYINICIKKPI